MGLGVNRKKGLNIPASPSWHLPGSAAALPGQILLAHPHLLPWAGGLGGPQGLWVLLYLGVMAVLTKQLFSPCWIMARLPGTAEILQLSILGGL